MTATNFPLEVLLLRDDEIPEYVVSGVSDLDLVGQNVVWEKAENVKKIKNLGFGKCRLSLAVDKNFDYHSVQDIDWLEIATS